MRLGALLLQVCAVVIAAALIFFGYSWYRRNEVKQFMQKDPDGTSLQTLYDYWASAPAMTCAYQASNFEGADSRISWHANGLSRFDFIDLAAGNQRSRIVLRANSYYVWSDEDENIARVWAGISKLESTLRFSEAILKEGTCEVWWNPDTSVFDIPADKPIIEVGLE